jgi:ABC-type branched-subunit amino acid transport system substrate-binding protein
MVSGQSSSSELDNEEKYPLFARTNPNEDYAARCAVKFWFEELKLRHVVVIHTIDPYGHN